MKNRPGYDQYFMAIAELVSTRSTCLRRKVGAVIVKDRHILTTGYNGAPSGMKHCDELGGCLREKLKVRSGQRHELCRGLHAEQNAIIQAALFGVGVKDSTMYCTNAPCVVCAKMMMNAGIKELVYADGYPDELAEEMLADSHIKTRIIKLKNKDGKEK